MPVNPDFSLTGFATMNGGTTGGEGGETVVVDSGRELQNALDDKNPDRPLTVLVNGTISVNNTRRENRIHISNVDDVSILGIGRNGRLDGVGIRISSSRNIIIRNLAIHEVDGGRDSNTIIIEGPANNIWIDHNEMSGSLALNNYYDELIETGNRVEFVTISYNYFHDNREAIRHGGGFSGANHYVTIHHNRFQNVRWKAPEFLSGFGHIYNNYYDNTIESGINARMGAHLRIENNHFQSGRNPILSSGIGPTGYWEAPNNIYENITWEQDFFTDVLAEVDPDDCSAQTAMYRPPYGYTLDSVEHTRWIALNYTGIGVIHVTLPRQEPEPSGGDDDDDD